MRGVLWGKTALVVIAKDEEELRAMKIGYKGLVVVLQSFLDAILVTSTTLPHYQMDDMCKGCGRWQRGWWL